MNKKYEIMPFVGVGSIQFNTSREIIRKNLGSCTEFRKSKFSRNTTDNFGNFHVYYSTENKVDAVEFFRGTEVFFKNLNIFDLNKDTVISLFDDSQVENEENILNFVSYGVEVVLDECEITSILVHKKGY